MATTEQTVENNNTQMLDVVGRTQIVTDLDTIKQLENTVDCQKESQDKMAFDLEYLQSVLSYVSNVRVLISLEGEHEKIHEYCRLIESIAEVCQVKVRELKERYDEFSSKTCDEFSKMKIEGRKIMQESCVSDHGEEYQDPPQEAIKAMKPEENEDELNGSLYDSDVESQNMLETERERLPLERSKPWSEHQPQNMVQSEGKSLPQESDEPNTDNQLFCLDPKKMIFCKRSCGLVALQVLAKFRNFPPSVNYKELKKKHVNLNNIDFTPNKKTLTPHPTTYVATYRASQKILSTFSEATKEPKKKIRILYK
ncbi:uncharacterized protein LOC124449377 [Xenia sp. Carnegie-2017]|uniref:uncharacterized protein LOC124449377 n=1 Tax=Xenia sp. Carnegie-2017 TaxID=2897299 RepID=UPI001F04868C|nr:uncharacterized protein LOC124449377 [Xenia sp. Carnegie-2017]